MFKSMTEVRRANAAAGNHWFEPGTMRFFRSRVSDRLYGGRYFVSSERAPRGARRYTVRVANDDGSIGTVGEFQAFASRGAAHRRAAWLAKEGA